MSLNKAMLIGNVGKDPEVRYLEQNPQNQAKVATFTLATTERFRDRNGEIRENTEWHNIVCWRNNADVVERFVKRGTQIYVEGRLRTRSWDGQDGTKHYTTEIIADTIQLLGRRPDDAAPAAGPGNAAAGGPAAPAARPAAQPAPAQPVAAPAAPDDDLPF